MNNIRKAFEAKAIVQRYHTKNVLQTHTNFRDNEWFQPFVKLNSDAMVEVDSKVGTLHLAIEFDTTNKSRYHYRHPIIAIKKSTECFTFVQTNTFYTPY